MKSVSVSLKAAFVCCSLALTVPPAVAQQASFYSLANGWEISQLRQNGQVVACEAMRITGSEEGLFIRYDRSNISIGFSSLGAAASPYPIDVDMWFDHDQSTRQTLGMQIVTDQYEFNWRALVQSNDEPSGELDLFMNASSIHFQYVAWDDMHAASFPLTGTNRAVKDTIACVQNAGQTQQSAPATATASPKVIYGSCKLIVDGQVYIDMRAGCPIWLAHDGTGSFTINNPRDDNGVAQYYAEVEPNGDGTASAHWNGQPGATHAQDPLGENFRMGRGGCWSNGRSTVCAAR